MLFNLPLATDLVERKLRIHTRCRPGEGWDSPGCCSSRLTTWGAPDNKMRLEASDQYILFNTVKYVIDVITQSYQLCFRCYHHHHVVLVAWISLTLSHHFSLSFIASGRSSGQHPVSSHSCWMYVRAGRPAFARPCVGVHKSTSLMSSSLLLQQCPACLVRLTWIVFVIGGRWPYSWCLVGCSRLLAAFLCNCRLASSPAVLLESI